jgi:hypothetical protein
VLLNIVVEAQSLRVILYFARHHDTAESFVRDQHLRVILKLILEAQCLRAILYFAPPSAKINHALLVGAVEA